MMQLTMFVIFVAGFLVQATVVQTQSFDIVQTAINNGNFRTLATALQAAGLVPTLQTSGPFTVFAPTDAAFAKLPAGTLTNLLRPENKHQLIQILKYHVIMGSFPAARIFSLRPPVQVRTLANCDVLVTNYGNSLRVNNANVIIPNIYARNGIIHVIDTVLLPPTVRRMGRRSSIPITGNLSK